MAEAKKEAKSKKEAEENKEIKKAEVVAEISPVEEESVDEPKATAKAGKRSSKAVKEAEEKEVKEARKADQSVAGLDQSKKTSKKPTRSKLERSGKKFREAAKLVEKDKVYELAEALDLATKTNPAKFDASVELHINLGVDPKQADQNVRGTVALPEGTGKTVRIAAATEGDDDKKAKSAGADIVGIDNIFAQLDKEQIEFDVLIAAPNMMPKLAKYAKLLGPRGLMPNPKSGTVTTDIDKSIKEAKAGKVEYRVDSTGIVHLSVGKVSFGKDKLENNAGVVIAAIKAAKPASLKGIYIKSAYITTTMGPSIKVKM